MVRSGGHPLARAGSTPRPAAASWGPNLLAVEAFEDHLTAPRGQGRLKDADGTGAAGGAPCGDLVRIDVEIAGDLIARAGFEAEGCGAATAAASATVELVQGEPFLAAARVGAREIAAALGGLSAGKFHAATLAADALHRALGTAADSVRSTREPRRTLRGDERRCRQRGRGTARTRAGRRRRRRDARAVGRPRGGHGAQLLLERGGRGSARTRAPDGPAASDARPARAPSATRSWPTSWRSTAPAGRPTHACAATACCGSTP